MSERLWYASNSAYAKLAKYYVNIGITNYALATVLKLTVLENHVREDDVLELLNCIHHCAHLHCKTVISGDTFPKIEHGERQVYIFNQYKYFI
jgi:hypothetical protein